MKLYPLTKLNGDKIAAERVVSKEGYLFVTGPDERVDIPVYSLKCNNQFIKFFNEQIDKQDIRNS